ncbi:unnamed protein product [Spirodela intermedia]|uniref:Uncharacterized protein n=2 Tax=Spirodela intermedia TaxID=51605 RepID=A0A7I8KE51_SPIIN|nr:unnamed protein product [Spirodela intermedia]
MECWFSHTPITSCCKLWVGRKMNQRSLQW